jgi:hypothetical protein
MFEAMFEKIREVTTSKLFPGAENGICSDHSRNVRSKRT